MKRWIQLGLRVVLLTAACHSSSAYHHDHAIEMDDDSPIEITVSSPFRCVPSTGFIVLHVHAKNRGSRQAEYQLRLTDRSEFGSGATSTQAASFVVGPQQVREIDILLPRSGVRSGTERYQNVVVNVIGPGVRSGFFSINDYRGGGDATAHVAMSESLAKGIWSKLESDLKSSSTALTRSVEIPSGRLAVLTRGTARALTGSSVKLSELPPDARALSGWSGLWMTVDEWNALMNPQRQAIRQWVMEGGSLFLGAGAAPGALFDLPSNLEFGVRQALGFGGLKLVRLEGGNLPEPSAIEDVLGLDGAAQPPWQEDYQKKWSVLNELGRPKLNTGLTIAFVCIFAVLIGPVNIMFLAPARRRYRLFFTTPLLSIAGSGVLLGGILIGDGVGATGIRNALVLFPAGENRAAIVQEQACRSRLLLQRSFRVPEEANFAHIPFQRQSDKRLSFSRSGLDLGGDWFRSRTTQSHSLRMSVPSRAEVSVKQTPDGAPTLLSSIPAELRQVFYIDPQGKYWTTDSVSTGRPAALRPAAVQDYDLWLQRAAIPFSENLDVTLQSIAHRRGYFYATSAAGNGVPVDTLKSVHWLRDNIVAAGPCAKGGE